MKLFSYESNVIDKRINKNPVGNHIIEISNWNSKNLSVDDVFKAELISCT